MTETIGILGTLALAGIMWVIFQAIQDYQFKERLTVGMIVRLYDGDEKTVGRVLQIRGDWVKVKTLEGQILTKPMNEIYRP